MEELLEDINLLRRGLEELNKRSLEQGKPVSRAELEEAFAKVRQEVRFTIDYKSIAEQIQPHLATPAKVEAVLATGTQQLQQVIGQIPRSVPVVGKVWGFTSWRLGLGVLTVILALLCLSVYSWKEKAVAEEQVANLQQREAERATQYQWLVEGYLHLEKESPKTARKYFTRKNHPQ